MSEWDAFPVAKPAAPAASEWDAFPAAAGPKPSGQDVSAISAAQSLPIVGAYAPKAAAYLRHLTRGGTTEENQAQIEADIADYEQHHPIRSAVGGMAIGSLPYAVAGEFAGPAKALGMTGRFLPAAIRGGATGAGIGAVDAATRGEDPVMGAIGGGATGAGSVAGGKLMGMAYDAALRRFRPLAPTQRLMPGGPVAGVDIPVSESQAQAALGVPVGERIAGARQEDIDRKMGGEQAKIASNLDTSQTQAFQQAHSNLEAQLAGQPPGGQAPAGVTPMSAGGSMVNDLVAQEQRRAQAEVARMTGAANQTAQLRAGYGPAPPPGGAVAPPASALDASQTIGQGIRTRQALARQRTTDAYDVAAQVPAGYNPLMMRNVGDQLVDMVNARPDVVRIDPDVTPAAFRASQSVDRLIQAQLLNAARRGEQLGPMEMEQVRKALVQQQQNALGEARRTNNYEDVRAIGRMRDAFDEWEQQLVRTPSPGLSAQGQPLPGGLLYGDPAQIMATRQAARAAHAQERQTFGRQGPGDAVGTFMGKVIGRFPGQELSPEGIVTQLMGTPNRPFNENSVPILRHLRDNVFGANSQEWAQLKQGLLDHLTGTAPGSEPVPLDVQANRLERFLANDRQAGALFTPQERAALAQHATALRAAMPDVVPAANTTARKIAALAGRFGQEAGGQQAFDALFSTGGERLAAEARRTVSQNTWNQMKQSVWREIAEPPEGRVWGHQKIAGRISDFLATPLAHEMFDTNERAVMRSLANAHNYMVPPVGSVNTSASAYTGRKMVEGLGKQLWKMIGGALGVTGGLTGVIHGAAFGKLLDEIGERRALRQGIEGATERFVGPIPRRAPVTAPQRFTATAARLLPAPSSRADQAEQQ